MTTEAFNTRVVQCGGCGAEITFAVGTSRLRVCDFCGYVTARTDGGGIEGLGKVADVVPTGARLTLGATGSFEGVGFRLAGRIQLAWAQGAWDEWYAAFDDGRWGWLAEAQGRYFVSFRVSPRPVPPLGALRPGRELSLHGLGRYVVNDLKSASYTAARGELPEPFPLDGRPVRLVDLSGANRSFATLDFGETGTEPTLFAGHEVTLDELRIGAEHVAPPERVKAQGKALTCPNCSAPVPLRAPDESLRVTCTHCAMLLDASQGELKALSQLKKMVQPSVPLGSKGTLDGVEWLAIGWMERACQVDGETYAWEEWILYDARTSGFRYLLCSDNHWSFVTPIAPGDVEYGPTGALYKGTTYRCFSSVSARVQRIWGEFPWAVKLGEEAVATDYIAPPQGLSHELSGSEVNWSHSTYLTPDEVKKAFGLERTLRQPSGVGAIQPSPWSDILASMSRVGGLAALVVIALFLFFAARARNTTVLEQTTTLVANRALGTDATDVPIPAPTPEAPYDASVVFSEPFEIDRPNRNMQVRWTSTVDQSWVFLNGALVNESTGEFLPFDGTSSYYSGYDDGAWSEDDREGSTYLSKVPMGRYVLRLEAQWPTGTPAPTVKVTLIHGVLRVWHLFLALLALGVIPVFAFFRASAFERERWEQSTEGSG